MSIDILACYENEPQPLGFVMPGLLAGTVGTLFSTDNSALTMWALQASMAVACDQPGGDLLNLQPEGCGRVVYFSAEDPEFVLRRRVYDIKQHMPTQAVNSIANQLDIETMNGKGTDLFQDEHLQAIVDYTHGARLIVFDTISCFHSDDDNDSGKVHRIVNRLRRLGKQTCAAILILHSASESALIGDTHWGASIRRMTTSESKKLSDEPFFENPISEDQRGSYVRVDFPKIKYTDPIEHQWYQSYTDGVLVPTELYDIKPKRHK